MAFIAKRVINLSALTDQSSPSMAFLETLIAIRRIGIMTGKLNIAIKVALLLAFEAIPDTMVRQAENPMAPNTKFNKNMP